MSPYTARVTIPRVAGPWATAAEAGLDLVGAERLLERVEVHAGAGQAGDLERPDPQLSVTVAALKGTMWGSREAP